MFDASSLIVVVDDDPGICRSLAQVLGTNGYRVRTYLSASDYLAESDGLMPACVLADVRMPDLDGLAMHRAVVERGLFVPTVFMTGSGDVATVVSAMREGAVDVLEKPFDASSVLGAVSAAVARSHVAREASAQLHVLWHAVSTLTPREAEVAALVATGRLNKQVAALLGTSEKTVKVHRARALRKLGVRSVAELVRFVDRALAAQDVSAPGHPSEAPPHALEIIASTLATTPRQP
jgi:FixJ family two-component response regulator